jgi:hypothetical protein
MTLKGVRRRSQCSEQTITSKYLAQQRRSSLISLKRKQCSVLSFGLRKSPRFSAGSSAKDQLIPGDRARSIQAKVRAGRAVCTLRKNQYRAAGVDTELGTPVAGLTEEFVSQSVNRDQVLGL